LLGLFLVQLDWFVGWLPKLALNCQLIFLRMKCCRK